jgi:modulator of FtsH protease HflK
VFIMEDEGEFSGNGYGPRRGDPFEPFLDWLRRHGGKVLRGAVVLALVGVGATGVYSVGPGEQAVVRTMGRESGKSGPGLHYRVPFVQRADVVNVEQVRRLEVGFRGDKREEHEALMITGDENIVEAQLIVQYRVSDPSKYLFRLEEPEAALRATAEVALRSMVGRTSIDEVITTGREKVQEDTHAWLQKLMNDYESGITVTEVKLQVVDAPDQVRDAFHDVVRAREEKEKLMNQARGYQADVIPRARGEARKLEREAEGYKEERVLRAKGDAARFESVLLEYKKAERVTRARLHLETMERVLVGVEKKVIVDSRASNGVLPFLPLTPGAQPHLAAAPAAPAPPAAGAK